MRFLLFVGSRLNKMKFTNRTKRNLKILIGYIGDLTPEFSFKVYKKGSVDFPLHDFNVIIIEEA